MAQLAPIALFVYNRPQHTLKTLESLSKNPLSKESIIYIYADGAKVDASDDIRKQIDETRTSIKSKQWCKEVHIIESNTNKGLADSILRGVTEVINKHGKVIVLEDDIVTAPCFLQYMNDALNLYKEEDKVMHISGYVPVTTGIEKLPDTYFLRFMSCWGWATWKDRWDQIITDINYLHEELPKRNDFSAFNLDSAINIFHQIELNHQGKMKTWAIKWYSTIFIKEGLCLYPRKSVVDNIGFDGSGQNTFCEDETYSVYLAEHIDIYPIKLKENKTARKYLQNFYIYGRDSSFKRRFKKKIKRTWVHKIYKKLRYRI